jgi:hypothetical protein
MRMRQRLGLHGVLLVLLLRVLLPRCVRRCRVDDVDFPFTEQPDVRIDRRPMRGRGRSEGRLRLLNAGSTWTMLRTRHRGYIIEGIETIADVKGVVWGEVVLAPGRGRCFVFRGRGTQSARPWSSRRTLQAGVGWPVHLAKEIVATGGAGFPSLPKGKMQAEG